MVSSMSKAFVDTVQASVPNLYIHNSIPPGVRLLQETQFLD